MQSVRSDVWNVLSRLTSRLELRGELPRGVVVADRIAAALNDLAYRARVRGVPTSGPTWDGLCALDPESPPLGFVADAVALGKALVILGGDVGVGKSVALAAAVLRAPAGAACSPLYAHAVPLAEAVARPYDDARRALCDRAERAPLLAIDDLGLEVRDERGVVLDALRGLLARRVDSGRATVISTNLEWREDEDEPSRPCLSRDYLDRRLLDRFAACGAITHARGRSLRRRAP